MLCKPAKWATIFCGHSWVAGGCYRIKKKNFNGKYQDLKLVSYKCFKRIELSV